MTSKTMYPWLFEAGTDVPAGSLYNRATGRIWLNSSPLVNSRALGDAVRHDLLWVLSGPPLAFVNPFFDWEQVCAWLGVQVMEGVLGCCRARSHGT